jgi:hypothetical protein
MAVEERSRRQLQEALMDTIGPEHTDTLLSYLPPTGWADVATTRDLDAMRAELRGEVSELRAEVRSEVSAVRGEISELRGEISGLRADMNTLAATVRGEMHHELRVQFYSLAALMAAMLAVAVAVFSNGLLG